MLVGKFSIFSFLLAVKCYSYELNILHVNDVHAHIDGTSRSSGLCREGASCYGGFARVMAKVKELRKSLPNVIFLSAGDMFTGTPYFTKFKSDVLVDFVNEMNFDAQALGNHEFDEGIQELSKYLPKITSPIVCCNIDISGHPSLKSANILDSVILNVGEVKVGIVGFLTTDVHPGKREKVIVHPEIPSLKKAVGDVRKKGAQIVVVVGHSGYEPEMEIAKEVDGIDAVVGGHSHTFLYSGKLPSDDFDKPKGPYPTVVSQITGKKVPVVQAFQFTKYLGHLRLEFDDGFRLVNASGNPILLKPSSPRDQKILEIQEKWDRNMTEMCQVVGEFTEDVDGDRTLCRFQECPMGNFVADAIQDYARKNLNGSHVISFIHGGLIRSSIEKGKATVAEVSSVLPFRDPIVTLRVTGATLRQALEFSVKDYSSIVGTPRFVQPSGLKVKFNLNKPVGSRMLEAGVYKGLNEPALNLTESDTYLVTMSKFTYHGGDNYTMFRDNNSPIVYQSDKSLSEIILEYLKTRGSYEPKKESRVEVVEQL
ncbi:5'-nucleotidase activity [Nesidiocoris tenuis]|uniref:5'-nucleotidase n=1 Tax=Nesidiocoris tenuis TaxID=355587 RepID=A0ABN7BC65_9HEMI|nr:5'-nucleotidase activity [Nesidiocoris tenuis]